MTPRERLFALEQFGIKLGLDNITALVAALNRPDRTFHTIHVGGTNGKGSVTAMVERGLRAAGHRTGRYTSPHLTDIEIGSPAIASCRTCRPSSRSPPRWHSRPFGGRVSRWG
jgi:hypothetical protein